MATCNGTTECECEETACPASEDGGHCECWWENEGCHRCGDPPCAVLARFMAAEDAAYAAMDTPAPDAGKE